jgi:hypothetical protein
MDLVGGGGSTVLSNLQATAQYTPGLSSRLDQQGYIVTRVTAAGILQWLSICGEICRYA